MNLKRGISFVVVLLSVVACNSAAHKPIAASAADQPSYAVRYPDALASSRGRFSEQESRAGRLTGDLGAFVNDVDTKNWKAAATVYRLADAAGKSQDYADSYEQSGAISTFFSEEKDRLNQ